MPRDIEVVDISKINWSDPVKGLEEVHSILSNKAKASERWYQSAMRTKAKGAVVTRLLAIVLGLVATLWPIIVTLLTPGDGSATRVRDLLPVASLCATLAAGCIVFDKFFGFSTSWMRYIAAFQDLQAKIERFDLTWARERWKIEAAGASNQEALHAALDVLITFHQSITELVQAETNAWIIEFKGVLVALDQASEAQRSAAASNTNRVGRGAVRLTVVGVENLDEHSWSVQAGDGPQVRYAGTALAALTGIEPGLVRIKVSASKRGTQVRAESVVKVEAGAIAELSLTPGLPAPP